MRVGLWVSVVVLALAGGACGEDGDAGGAEQVVQTVWARGDAPVAGVEVQIDDSAWVTTDAEGRARFPAVAGPFTARAHVRTGPELERRDDVWQLADQIDNPLVLAVSGPPRPDLHAAMIFGRVLGVEDGDGTLVSTIAHAGQARAATSSADPDGEFRAGIDWSGPTSATAEVLVLRSTQADGLPSDYLEWGATPVELSDPDGLGAFVFGLELELEPVSEALVSGMVAPPEGLDRLVPIQALELADRARADLVYYASAAPPGAFERAVPVLGGATPIVGFRATRNDSFAPVSLAERRVTDLDAEVDLALPAPVEVLAPADDGTLDLADEIEWSGGPEGGGHLVYLACRTATGLSTGRDVVYRLVEPERRSTAVPAIPGVGLGIGCSWRVGWSSDGAFPELGIGGRTDDEHLESWSAERRATIP